MKLQFRCPHCDAQNFRHRSEEFHRINCESCGWERPVTQPSADASQLSECLVCGNHDLWRQKDFPQSIGLTFVAAGATLSSIAWYYHRPVWALGILLAFAAADLVLFAIMPDVLVCYRCGARHSGGDLSEHPTFDHETAEKYRQQKLRLEEAAKSSPG
ncbi:MAG: hypothetical protein KDA86_07120 [Planctomycetaceae bacterium]|nr:hypothetical protein [Planctomycetaceae bacterium]